MHAPPPPASAFSGSVGKNAVRKEESVVLQLLVELLLLELLRETGLGARLVGEKHYVTTRHRHAEAQTIKRIAAHATYAADSSHALHGAHPCNFSLSPCLLRVLRTPPCLVCEASQKKGVGAPA